MLDSTISMYVVMVSMEMMKVTARYIIKALKRTTGFATFGVDAAEEMVGKYVYTSLVS